MPRAGSHAEESNYVDGTEGWVTNILDARSPWSKIICSGGVRSGLGIWLGERWGDSVSQFLGTPHLQLPQLDPHPEKQTHPTSKLQLVSQCTLNLKDQILQTVFAFVFLINVSAEKCVINTKQNCLFDVFKGNKNWKSVLHVSNIFLSFCQRWNNLCLLAFS